MDSRNRRKQCVRPHVPGKLGADQLESLQAMCQTSRAREAGSGSAGIAASNVSDLTCPGNWGRTAGNAASNTPGACARKLTRTGICVPQLAPGDPVEGMWDRECWGPAGGCAAERAAFLRLKMLPRSAAWQGLRDAAGTSNLCPGKNRRRDAYRHARYAVARLWC